MHAAALINGQKLNELTPDQNKLGWDDILGYRKRDVIFFENAHKIPIPLQKLYRIFSEQAQDVRREELLQECGIDPHEWHEQLHAENILL